MKLIKTEDAVGQVLCHDITQIIKGVTKDAVFRKGHIITEEDIPVLLSVGKDHIYIWEKDDTILHENEAAQILYEMCKNDHMHPSDVKEGKIELIADCNGLLKVDKEKLKKVNSFGEMMIASRHGNTPVKAGDKLAGTRIIPLVIKKDKMERVKAICADAPIFIIKAIPIRKKLRSSRTGNEVYHGRTKILLHRSSGKSWQNMIQKSFFMKLLMMIIKRLRMESCGDRGRGRSCDLYRRHECGSG